MDKIMIDPGLSPCWLVLSGRQSIPKKRVVFILILPYLANPLEPEPVEGEVDDGGGVDVDGGGVDVDGGVNALVVDDSGLVVVGCVEAEKGADEKVGVGVARLTFIGLKVV
jgi:hypothetical protein